MMKVRQARGAATAKAKAKGVSRCDGAVGKVGWGHCGRFGGSGAPYSETNGTFVLMLLWCFGMVVWCGAFMGGGNGALGTGDIM